MILSKIQNEKGNLQISFGFIFSIIIIIATISVAFYALTLFMNNAEKIKFNVVVNEIKNEIINARTGQESDKIISVSTPKGIEMLCFYDSTQEIKGIDQNIGKEIENSLIFNENFNFYFYPLDMAEKYSSNAGWRIKCSEYEDVNCLKFNENPYCIPVNKGIAKIRIINEGNYDGIIQIREG